MKELIESRIGITIFCGAIGIVLGFLCGQKLIKVDHQTIYDTTYINVPKQETPSYAGKINATGMFLRCQDSLAYAVAAEFAHKNGYSDIFWNQQADRPHWDMWTGETYKHVFLDDILK